MRRIIPSERKEVNEMSFVDSCYLSFKSCEIDNDEETSVVFDISSIYCCQSSICVNFKV